MSKYIRYYNEVSAQEWAEQNLTQEELVQFNLAFEENNKLWASYASNGLISVVPITEQVNIPELNQNIDIQIGEQIVLSQGTTRDQLELAPAWKYWLDRYAQAVPDAVVTFES